MASVSGGPAGANMAAFDVSTMLEGVILQNTSTSYSVEIDSGETVTYQGTGFTYDSAGLPSNGSISAISISYDGESEYQITDISVPMPTFVGWVNNEASADALLSMLGGADTMTA